MAKILVCPDIHFSVNSSIIRSRGQKYSSRIENCIQSINWVEQTAIDQNCSAVFYLGDFFNQNVLDSEQITALKELKFAEISHFAIAGNHEISTTNNAFNSLNVLSNLPNFEVFTEPYSLYCDDLIIDMLPYEYDCSEDITDYFPVYAAKKILLSHNMLRGLNFCGHITEDGLDMFKLQTSYDLVLNGHIHNHSKVADKIYNVGLLTGQNFNEDAFIYKHYVALVDTNTLDVEFLENPYAYNFVQFSIEADKDFDIFNTLPSNCVSSIKCEESLVEKAREFAEKYCVEYRFFITRQAVSTEEESKIDLSINPMQRLRECCLSKIGTSDILLEELSALELQEVN